MKFVLIIFLNLILISNVFGQTKTKITSQCTEGNCINGKGKKVWSNGRVYIGDFKNGLRDGNGINEINGHRYEGDWKEGKLNGQGKMTYKSGKVYEGQWKDNKENGHGKMTWPNGHSYLGEHKNKYRHGQGKYDYADGAFYVGSWEKNKKHGKGELTLPSREIIKGTWKNDKRIKKVAKIDAKKYWEGALNCFKYTNNPIKQSQRPYIDQLTLSVENYKRYKNSNDENDIIMYSKMIVENLGCSKNLFK